MFAYKESYRLVRQGYEVAPADSLEDVSGDVKVLHVTRKTLALERLPRAPRIYAV